MFYFCESNENRLNSVCSKFADASISRMIEEAVKDDKMLEEGDSVMADHAFDVEDILAQKKVRWNVPSRLEGRPRIQGKDVEKTHRIAEVRIHVERNI